jgi:hypothetical protein
LARGLLEIADTPEGERMRLRASRHAEGMQARVEIAHGATAEQLDLLPVGDYHHHLERRQAPAEPHEFAASLRLEAAGMVGGTGLLDERAGRPSPLRHQRARSPGDQMSAVAR